MMALQELSFQGVVFVRIPSTFGSHEQTLRVYVPKGSMGNHGLSGRGYGKDPQDVYFHGRWDDGSRGVSTGGNRLMKAAGPCRDLLDPAVWWTPSRAYANHFNHRKPSKSLVRGLQTRRRRQVCQTQRGKATGSRRNIASQPSWRMGFETWSATWWRRTLLPLLPFFGGRVERPLQDVHCEEATAWNREVMGWVLEDKRVSCTHLLRRSEHAVSYRCWSNAESMLVNPTNIAKCFLKSPRSFKKTLQRCPTPLRDNKNKIKKGPPKPKNFSQNHLPTLRRLLPRCPSPPRITTGVHQELVFYVFLFGFFGPGLVFQVIFFFLALLKSSLRD